MTTKAHPSTPFVPIFAAEPRPSVQAEQEARQPLQLRTVCCFCEPHHVLIEGIEPTSHGMCDAASDRWMAALDAKYGAQA